MNITTWDLLLFVKFCNGNYVHCHLRCNFNPIADLVLKPFWDIEYYAISKPKGLDSTEDIAGTCMNANIHYMNLPK